MDRLDRQMVAADVLRALVEEARYQTELERAGADRLRTLIRAGGLVGISAADLAAASGLSRPGVYEVHKGQASGPVPGLDEILLITLAARGGATREQLLTSLRVERADLDSALEKLIRRGAVVQATAGYDGRDPTEILLVSASGEELMSNELRRVLSRRPDRWVAYLAVDRAEAQQLLDAALRRFARHYRPSLIPETVRSDMSGPELALVFSVKNERELFNDASRVWYQLRQDAKLDQIPPTIVAISAPKPRSEVLEAFAAGIVKANPEAGKQVAETVSNMTSDTDDFTLSVRALTEAAWALRRSVGQHKNPPSLSDGEAAFGELQPVAGLHLDGVREKARRALLRALERATDTFGPIPAGRLSTGGIVEPVEPTRIDLIDIARRSGETVGLLSAEPRFTVDAIDSLRRVVVGDDYVKRSDLGD